MVGTNSGEAFMFTLPFVSYHDLTTKLNDDLGKNNARKIEAFYNITTDDRENNLSEQYNVNDLNKQKQGLISYKRQLTTMIEQGDADDLVKEELNDINEEINETEG